MDAPTDVVDQGSLSGQIVVEPMVLEVEHIDPPLTEEHAFNIRNVGSGVLKLSHTMFREIDGSTASSFAITEDFGNLINRELEPGESVELRVIYRPRGVGTGMFEVDVFSDDPNTPVFTVSLIELPQQ